MVGVLRAGAAVLPLEPGHSAGLQEFLMRDAGVWVVVSDCGLLGGEIPVVKTGGFVIAVRPPLAVRREVPPGTAFMALPAGGDPGRALAVRPVAHADVLSWVDSCVPMLGATVDDVWACSHSLSLDLGMREMWGPLLSGGRAVVVDGDTAGDARAFARLLAREEVTVVTQLPSGFARLSRAARGTVLPRCGTSCCRTSRWTLRRWPPGGPPGSPRRPSPGTCRGRRRCCEAACAPVAGPPADDRRGPCRVYGVRARRSRVGRGGAGGGSEVAQSAAHVEGLGGDGRGQVGGQVADEAGDLLGVE